MGPNKRFAHLLFHKSFQSISKRSRDWVIAHNKLPEKSAIQRYSGEYYLDLIEMSILEVNPRGNRAFDIGYLGALLLFFASVSAFISVAEQSGIGIGTLKHIDTLEQRLWDYLTILGSNSKLELSAVANFFSINSGNTDAFSLLQSFAQRWPDVIVVVFVFAVLYFVAAHVWNLVGVVWHFVIGFLVILFVYNVLDSIFQFSIMASNFVACPENETACGTGEIVAAILTSLGGAAFVFITLSLGAYSAKIEFDETDREYISLAFFQLYKALSPEIFEEKYGGNEVPTELHSDKRFRQRADDEQAISYFLDQTVAAIDSLIAVAPDKSTRFYRFNRETQEREINKDELGNNASKIIALVEYIHTHISAVSFNHSSYPSQEAATKGFMKLHPKERSAILSFFDISDQVRISFATSTDIVRWQSNTAPSQSALKKMREEMYGNWTEENTIEEMQGVAKEMLQYQYAHTVAKQFLSFQVKYAIE